MFYMVIDVTEKNKMRIIGTFLSVVRIPILIHDQPKWALPL